MKQLPAQPIVMWRIRQICRFTVAGIWLYQGLVPKLLGPHQDEIAMATAFGIRPDLQPAAAYAAGVAELALGFCILLLPRQTWPQLASAIAAAGLLAFVALYTPAYLVGAFNPVVMNCALMALSVVAVLVIQSRIES